MSESISDNSVFVFSKMHRLQWEPTQDKHVILYPEGMVELNPTSAAILALCDGKQHFSEMLLTLEEKFSAQGIRTDVESFLCTALEKNWVQLATQIDGHE